MGRTRLMGILNATSDSLYGAQIRNSHVEIGEIVWGMIEDGADIIDIGGESTGPKSVDVSAEVEWKRIEPFLKFASEAQKDSPDMIISIDTYKAEVFGRSLSYNVSMLNDVTALRGDADMVALVAKSGVKVCLMYSAVSLNADENDVRVSNDVIEYTDVIKTIGDFLEERIEYCLSNGVKKSQIILDPGMGSFVSGDARYSYEILDRLPELKKRFETYPFLIGASRKGFTGEVFEGSRRLPVEERLIPSIAALTLAVKGGADFVRVHDVKESKRAVDFLDNF